MKTKNTGNIFDLKFIMAKILVINASPRGHRSHSRALTGLFIKTWQTRYPDDSFTNREVGQTPVPHITENWIAAAFKDKATLNPEDEKVLKLSNELVNELKNADLFVIGTPMYNWGIPSGLKAYIDQIMRINETWKFRSGEPDGDYVGLLENKKLYILSSRGDSGYNKGETNEYMNFQTTYLKTVFNIMGVSDVEIISLDNEEYGGERFAKSQREINQRILQIR